LLLKDKRYSTLTVCSSGCPFTTIQGAINAAINGDTVLVSPGTYNETINFYGKAITVKGAKGASQTIIDGGGLGTVVYFGSGEGNNSVLDGFTIKGGSAMYGGGIRAINSSPIIKNNIITGNTADNSGGAISVYDYSSPVITNNTITGNTSLYGAGGISVARYSSPVITNNILWGNGSTEIEDNPNQGANTITASYNIVQGGYTGTGNINADPLFVDPANGNFQVQSGSPAIDTGMNTSIPTYGSVIDDIIGTVRPQDGDGLGAGTTGDGSDYDMGAYEYISTAPSTFTLTITKGDTGSGVVTSNPAGIDCGADCSEAYNSGTTVNFTPTPDASSYFAGWSGDADCSDGSVTMDADKTCTAMFTLNSYNLNITINPSAGGTVTAPGINCPGDCTESYNYGNNVPLTAAANTGYTFTGWSGDADCSDGVLTMDANKTCTATFNLLTTLTVCPSGCPFTTIQAAINAAANGFTITVSAGTYNENINFNGKAITVKGEKGANQTVINGGGLGSVVNFASGEGNSSVLDGFTIKGGNNMYYGGGIHIYSSSPAIKNNIITGNTATYSGGAIAICSSSSVITNNTISGNTSLYGSGGISVACYSSPVITNTILWGNGSTEIQNNPTWGANTITVSHSIVQGGYSGTGNINADPLFVAPLNGDYHLQTGSPAIDTGMNTSTSNYGSVTDDIEGTGRPQDGDGLGAGTTGDGSDYDIGAYEYLPLP